MGACVVVVVLQFCFCAVSLAHGPFHLSKIPWFVYFIGFIWPVVLLPVQELVKMHDNKEFTRFQKRSKLEFSTKVIIKLVTVTGLISDKKNALLCSSECILHYNSSPSI